MEITRDIAQTVRDVVDAGLVGGLGKPKPGQMCVEAAVCYALGLPHGDAPGCVSPALRTLKIALNDSDWSSPQARAHGLRRLAIAQLGSAGVLDEHAFAGRVSEMTIRRVVPMSLRSAATVNPSHAAALEAAAVECETDGTAASAASAESAASAASAASAESAVWAARAESAESAESAAWAASAARAAARAARAESAAWAASAARAAARAARAESAAWAESAARAARAASDRVLGTFAELVVEILIDMQAPGCQWLDLVPLNAQTTSERGLHGR